MDIVVLSGGLSSERDVAIISGSKIANALREKGHRVVVLDVFMGYEKELVNPKDIFDIGYDFTANNVIGEKAPTLAEIKAKRKDKSDSFFGENVIEICKAADICFLGLHGGEGENGQIQACLDLLGIKYTGSNYLGAAVAMDKGITKGVFISNNIPTPQGSLFKKEDLENGNIDKWNSFPCVVKPCSGGSSVGVHIVESKEEFLSSMEDAFSWESSVLVEQYIKGREFSVGILGKKALPIIEIIPNEGFYDYVNKYQAGKTLEICPAELDEDIAKKMQREAEHVFEALHLDAYARADFLLDENGNFYCLEANTLPGMTPMSLLPQEARADGIEYNDLCEKIIEYSLQKYR